MTLRGADGILAAPLDFHRTYKTYTTYTNLRRIGFALNQTNHFFDLGYGWLCKHCSAEDAERRQHELHHHTRFIRQESHQQNAPHSPALARWSTPERLALNCPRCGVEEQVRKH